MSNRGDQTVRLLVIPLLSGAEDLSVFDEVGGEPVSLRRKAQFFIDQKLYGRARQILELLSDLGSRDDALALTLASLQILDGNLQLARDTLGWIAAPELYRQELTRCLKEIERQERVKRATVHEKNAKI